MTRKHVNQNGNTNEMDTVLNVRKCLCKINELVKENTQKWFKKKIIIKRPHKGANVKKKEKSKEIITK